MIDCERCEGSGRDPLVGGKCVKCKGPGHYDPKYPPTDHIVIGGDNPVLDEKRITRPAET